MSSPIKEQEQKTLKEMSEFLSSQNKQKSEFEKIDELIALCELKYQKACEANTAMNEILDELHKQGIHYKPAQRTLKFKGNKYTKCEFLAFLEQKNG